MRKFLALFPHWLLRYCQIEIPVLELNFIVEGTSTTTSASVFLFDSYIVAPADKVATAATITDIQSLNLDCICRPSEFLLFPKKGGPITVRALSIQDQAMLAGLASIYGRRTFDNPVTLLGILRSQSRAFTLR